MARVSGPMGKRDLRRGGFPRTSILAQGFGHPVGTPDPPSNNVQRADLQVPVNTIVATTLFTSSILLTGSTSAFACAYTDPPSFLPASDAAASLEDHASLSLYRPPQRHQFKATTPTAADAPSSYPNLLSRTQSAGRTEAHEPMLDERLRICDCSWMYAGVGPRSATARAMKAGKRRIVLAHCPAANARRGTAHAAGMQSAQCTSWAAPYPPAQNTYLALDMHCSQHIILGILCPDTKEPFMDDCKSARDNRTSSQTQQGGLQGWQSGSRTTGSAGPDGLARRRPSPSPICCDLWLQVLFFLTFFVLVVVVTCARQPNPNYVGICASRRAVPQSESVRFSKMGAKKCTKTDSVIGIQCPDCAHSMSLSSMSGYDSYHPVQLELEPAIVVLKAVIARELEGEEPLSPPVALKAAIYEPYCENFDHMLKLFLHKNPIISMVGVNALTDPLHVLLRSAMQRRRSGRRRASCGEYTPKTPESFSPRKVIHLPLTYVYVVLLPSGKGDTHFLANCCRLMYMIKIIIRQLIVAAFLGWWLLETNVMRSEYEAERKREGGDGE
ncbi:hypothetical protein BD310DRAFT_910099 [Dichomitus squalens]|uniref:Uncharacterized protein n=1 Tax=Dichomitus squalens TaxID=114155 RepID=A0A4Q9PCT4_9APHY|nr:hypothetical protein BD310DRAFT_910099 [Dichomitus squalens]